ncbi:MAG: hypothetical protein ACO3A2_08545 [Bdellovibrionia bacterium]
MSGLQEAVALSIVTLAALLLFFKLLGKKLGDWLSQFLLKQGAVKLAFQVRKLSGLHKKPQSGCKNC